MFALFRPIATLGLALAVLLPTAALAELQSKVVDYKDGDTPLRGHLFWDDSIEGKRPGVIVVHEWWGLDDYALHRAKMLAEMGFVAFAADMYGDSKVTNHAKEASGWMQQITANVDQWQQRALLGLDVLMADPHTDAERMAAIGYCFGGATVMQMAYAGADLDAVVSFHGSLPVASEAQAKAIKGKVLVAHGNQDSFIPAERVDAFRAALDGAGVDWEMDIYGGVRHGFTNPGAGSYGIDNLKYDAEADVRSWKRMTDLFAEIFSVE
ncbi:MAG: dienelactone hydrolase family protein [Chromatiales bacterium]|nr:dienelactone hydrolase family protein [Chromatiales bacterium]